MSTPTYNDLVPSPIKVAAMAPMNIEMGYAVRAFQAMRQRNATIVATGPANVYRQDGNPMTPQDLRVPQTMVYWNGLGFGWVAVSGSNTGWYVVQIPLNLSDGSLITRSFLLPVVGAVG